MLCDDMDGPGEYYTKSNKPVRKSQIPYDFTHVESNEQNELTKKMGTDPQMDRNMTASRGGRLGVEGLSKKEKGLMDMDNSMVIAGGRGCKGTK